MIDKALLDVLPMVTTPLSLVAFLASAVVLMHARTVGRAERLIKTAPESDRSTLVAGALDILDVRSKNLSREQRFELALEILAHRRHRNMLMFTLSLIFGVLLGGLALYSFTHSDINKDIEKILLKERRETVIPILNRSGIFEATDSNVVEYLAKKVTLPQAHNLMNDRDRDSAARELYDSVASVKELRRRADKKEEPFKPLGVQVIASIPNRIDQPWQYFVHVPMDSKYANRLVKITGADGKNYIRVFARSAMDATDSQVMVHLNKEQAIYLNQAFPASGMMEIAIRETVEQVYDPNCSITGRAPQFQPRSNELCRQGGTVTPAYLQGLLAR